MGAMLTGQQSSRWLSFAPFAAGFGFIAAAVIRVIGYGIGYAFRGRHDHPIEYVLDAFVVVALIGVGLGSLAIASAQGGRGKWAARVIAFGDVLLVIGVLLDYAIGEDPEWLFVLAVLALPLNLVGLLVLAALSWAPARFPRWAILLIATTVIPGFIGGAYGMSVIPAIGWIGIGWRLRLLQSNEHDLRT